MGRTGAGDDAVVRRQPVWGAKQEVVMTKEIVRIGGASGFWGDASMSTPQLLADGKLDYIVYDYLAEITMSIMARARAKSPDLGYATDFVSLTLQNRA